MLKLADYKTELIPLSQIDFADKTYQYRERIEPKDVKDLIASFKESGQEFPILVRRTNKGTNQIICGFRRYTAAKELGWDKIAAVVVPESDMPDTDAERLSVDENMKRKSLTSLDLMFLCRKMSQDKKSNVYIGKLIGKTEGQVRRYLKVAGAPSDVQDKVKTGETSINEVAENGARSDYEQRKMTVKSTKSGFNVILRYNRNKDDAKAAIEFLNKVLERLKGEVAKAGNRENGKGDEGQAANGTASQPSDSVEIKHILIEGRCRGKAGDVLELRVAGYDKESNKVDPCVLNLVWDVSNSAVAELIQTSGAAVKLKLKACGTCFVHAKHGNLKTSAGIEVL